MGGCPEKKDEELESITGKSSSSTSIEPLREWLREWPLMTKVVKHMDGTKSQVFLVFFFSLDHKKSVWIFLFSNCAINYSKLQLCNVLILSPVDVNIV